MNSQKDLVRTSQPYCVGRREFMVGCAACASMFALGGSPSFAGECRADICCVRPRLRLVFTHISPDTPTWPNIGYDYEGRKAELTAKLQEACPAVEFLPVTVQNRTEAENLVKSGEDIDGYIVYMLGIWTGAPQVIGASGKPTLFVDDLYGGSGEFLTAYSAAKRNRQRVAYVSSSRFEDVVRGVKCFECIKKLQASTIVDVTDQEKLRGDVDAIRDVFGVKILQVKSPEMNAAYEKADRKEAAKWARFWTRKARKVVEPTPEDIEKSAAFYLAMWDIMQQYGAQAIAVDCLGLFYGGKLSAYPCMGFTQLNNDGYVGACEGDLPSTLTMLMMTYLAGVPGYISDPVIDTSKNQIIYAHCVAPTKVFGPNGKSNPYHIRSHSEDRKGACVRSLMPLGETVTTLEIISSRKQIIFHQGVTVENIDEDKACRNKLAAEVKGDINKLLSEWDRWGWHRVTFYGDHKQSVRTLNDLMGFELIEEA